jgi:hypothetical protein
LQVAINKKDRKSYRPQKPYLDSLLSKLAENRSPTSPE